MNHIFLKCEFSIANHLSYPERNSNLLLSTGYSSVTGRDDTLTLKLQQSGTLSLGY